MTMGMVFPAPVPAVSKQSNPSMRASVMSSCHGKGVLPGHASSNAVVSACRVCSEQYFVAFFVFLRASFEILLKDLP